jgi:hypothetical protein
MAAVHDAEIFLRELGRGIPDTERVLVGYAPEATVQSAADGKKINNGWWPRAHREGAHIDASVNAYACISSAIQTLNPKTNQMRYWRSDNNFGHGLALMVDDIGTGKGSKGALTVEMLASILPPTVVVETSPGNHQLWYFLAEPEPDKKVFKAFLTCFVAAVLKKGGDHTIKDICRVGRMPCGVNNKRLADGSLKYPVDSKGISECNKPFQVRQVFANYEYRYTPQEIAKAFKFIIAVPVAHERVAMDRDAFRIQHLQMKMAEAILNAQSMGEGSDGNVTLNASGKYRIQCPWGDEHSTGNPYGAYFRGPIPGAEVEFVFGCAHDGCRKEKRGWSAFIDKVVIPVVADQLEAANCRGLDWEIIKNNRATV